MDINPTPNELTDDPPIDDALRAAEIHYGLRMIHRFAELSEQLATLIVEDAEVTPTRDLPIEKSPAKPTHAADVDRLFRGVRRGIRLIKHLLEPPKPDPAPARTQPVRPVPNLAFGFASGLAPRHRDDTDHLDRLDNLDSEYIGPRPPPTDAGKILAICREHNIKAAHGTTPLLDRPLKEVQILGYKVGDAINAALRPFNLSCAWGKHPKLPDTS